MDTPGSRRGDFKAIINEIKWELKFRKREDVKIFLSGGLTEDSILEYKDIADGFGIGTYVSNSPTIDFALDIVKIEETEIAKRGKFAGRKQVSYCSECQIYECIRFNEKTKKCSNCGKITENLLEKVIEKGKLVIDKPSVQEIKEYIAEQLKTNKEL